MEKIEIHADDYGVTMEASRIILEAVKAGKLSAVSILPNMSCFEDAALLWTQSLEKSQDIRKSVHLNFMEGYCVAGCETIPDLVDEKGLFKLSWMDLVKCNYNKKIRGKIKIQLKREISAQISRVTEAYNLLKDRKLSVDSHQHTHMIPLVMEALLEVIEEEKYPVEYIRLSREVWKVYLKRPGFYLTYRPVNLIKVMILNYFAGKDEKLLKKANLPEMILCGVFLSGTMDERRVKSILPALRKTAIKKNLLLEVLFHPGGVKEEELGEEFNQPGGRAFYLSTGRRTEWEALDYFKRYVKAEGGRSLK